MKNLFLSNRGKLVSVFLILIFAAVVYLVTKNRSPACEAMKVSFSGIDMKFPKHVSDVKMEYNLSFDSYMGMHSVFNDVSKKFDGPLQYFKVMFPLSWNELSMNDLPESSILDRQVNGYSFYLMLDGDSLRRKLETDFGGKFVLKENKPAIESGSKWTTCYEMKVNNCLYVATSNFGRGRSINWITFVYGLSDAERAEFYH